MIIDTVVNSLQTTSKVKGSKMSININGSSFGFILENLYTNPHKAIVRELVCNAIDAHQSVGNTSPYFIQVPSKFDTTFILRDFGCGLNEEEIEKYLNTLYESSKGGTNDQIGGFGLGSKSPFALVPSFFLTSYKDGFEYKCFWYRDSEGIPVLKVQSTTETTEPNGLKYTISFEEKDVDLIASACRSELFNFSLLPKFFSDINDPSTEYDLWEPFGLVKTEDKEEYSIYTATDTSIFSSNNGYYYRQPTISIGGVMYRLESRDCAQLFNLKLNLLVDNAALFVMKVPIGKLKLPSTREHVLETTENINIIKEYIEITFDALAKKMQAKYQELFDEDFKTESLAINIHNYFKFCSMYGYNLKGLNTVLYKDVNISDIGILNFLADTDFQGYKLSIPGLSYNTSLYQSVFNLHFRLNKNSKISDSSDRLEPLFLVQNVSTANHRLSPRRDQFSPLNYSNRVKTLFIFADSRVTVSYLYGLKDIDQYKSIEVIRPNPVLFEHPNVDKEYKDAYNIFNLIAGACGWDVIRASEVTKPENHQTKSLSTSTQAFSHFRYVTTSEYNTSKKIFKLVGADNKFIPFGLDYIDLTSEVFYKFKTDNNWLSQYIRYYMKCHKIEKIYNIDPSKEQEFLDLFKDHPTVEKVHKVSNNLQLDLKPLFNDEIILLMHLYQILITCQTNVKLFELLARNMIANNPHISEENFKQILNHIETNILNYGRAPTQGVMFASIQDWELRTVVCQLKDFNPYIDQAILDTAYSNLTKESLNEFLATCIPPALTDYIDITIKEK